MMTYRFHVVTSFPTSAWEEYGRDFVESYIKHWPSDVPLLCYCDGMPMPEDAPTAPNVYYIDLLECDDLVDFKQRNKQFNGKNGGKGYNFHFDAIKFSHKVYAQHEAMQSIVAEAANLSENCGYLMWLDADSVTFDDVTHELLDSIVKDTEKEVYFLGRKNAYATCTSLILYDLDNAGSLFLECMADVYNTDEVLKYQCFADNFVFDRVKHHLSSTYGVSTHNWTEDCNDLEAFEKGPLGRYVLHLKGNKKYSSTAPIPNDTTNLVKELSSQIEHFKSKNLFEVGVGNLENAFAMIKAAFINNDTVHYTACDDFLGVCPTKAAHLKLSSLAEAYRSLGKTLTYHLLEGDPEHKVEVLDEPSVCNLYNIKPDYMLINYGKVPEGCHVPVSNTVPVVVLIPHDHVEFYDDDEKPEREYVRRFGDEDRETMRIILNNKDVVDLPSQVRVPVKINPRDCVPPDNIQNNVRHNMQLFNGKEIRERCHWHDKKAIIVSGGPSIKTHMNEIKKFYDEGGYVVCVKHSHNILIENGIIPWGCIILDPRPLEGVSTHGEVRKDLIANPHPDTKYLIASMTHTDVIEYLLSKNANVIGWHAFTGALQDMEELQETTMITGGTCSAMRSLGLMHTLGFREFHIFGMDCCHPDVPEDKDEIDMYGRKKWLKTGIHNPKTGEEEIFYTTGELLALAQDFESLLERQAEVDMDLYVYGRGMAKAIFEGSDYKVLPTFNEDTFYNAS